MTETQKKWQERVVAWKASGKTCEEFVEGQGYAATTLRQWVFQLRKKEREAKAETVTLAKVVRQESSSNLVSTAMVVDVAGARIEVRRGFDRGLLRELIAALTEGR